MLTPKPTQLSGARFLAARRTALLADLPRVGKTGTALIAADLVMAENILVVTTASGRGVWQAGVRDWSVLSRSAQTLTGGARLRPDEQARVCIVSWGAVTQAAVRSQLLRQSWDLIILDEAHAAKNFATKRTQSVYGVLTADGLDMTNALVGKAKRVWPLTGTPLPNCPLDAYPMMRALCPARLRADEARGWPDVTDMAEFTTRYAKMRPLKVGHGFYAKRIDVFVEGRNLDELRGRLDGFFLQRTQQDVGILEPEYETMPLEATLPPELLNADRTRILEAAERGSTRDLDLALGPLRRLTGEIKAHATVDAVKEEFDAGLDKIVLAYWHRDVGQILAAGLSKFGAVQIDGSTLPTKRTEAERAFLRDPQCRVFLGQIQAAGEAIDLSSARHLIFVESSLTPKDMLQMSLRITNHTQRQRPLVRVATLAGSIDDALEQILLRKWSAIGEVMKR